MEDAAVIVEIVLFDLPVGMTREEVIAKYRQTAPKWLANPDLIRKNYLYADDGRRGGGVYLWPNRASAERAHDAAWIAMATQLYGSRPSIQYFETPILVDNAAGQILETGAPEDKAA
jgi:hypothetical protein